MQSRAVLAATMIIGFALGSGCATAPSSPQAREELVKRATQTLKEMYVRDPSLESFVKQGHAYALFPEVSKGGLVFGGAYGQGVVYEQDKLVGYADLTNATFGFQAGGQTYSELLVFPDEVTLQRFKAGRLDFAGNASAVVLKTGTVANLRSLDGVVVIVQPTAGGMLEAAIGGEQYTFAPL